MNMNASHRWIFVLFALLLVLSGCSKAQTASTTPNAPGPKINLFSKRIIVVGKSMEPTIKEKQRLTYDAVKVSELQRGDILVFKKEDNTLIRRLVGLPNETIEIREGVVYVNDQALKEAYILETTPETSNKITLAGDEYFLLGDNRSNTNDSREFGPVKAADIFGRVALNP